VCFEHFQPENLPAGSENYTASAPELTRTTGFGRYVRVLCRNLAEVLRVSDGAVMLTCDSERLAWSNGFV
jgi:hypothetical protein